jgi:hypothetical protein
MTLYDLFSRRVNNSTTAFMNIERPTSNDEIASLRRLIKGKALLHL